MDQPATTSATTSDHAPLAPGELARIVAMIDRPVVLVGMMGTGKTTVGRKLAALINAPFLDADEEIERAAQMPVAEIFAQFGEAHFRDGERRVIARLLADGPAGTSRRRVLATGGGAFVDPKTRALIVARTVSVWLDSDIDTLVERVGRKDSRPLLKGGDPRAILTRLREERRAAYSQAAIHVVSGNQPHAVTAARILKAIGQWSPAST